MIQSSYLFRVSAMPQSTSAYVKSTFSSQLEKFIMSSNKQRAPAKHKFCHVHCRSSVASMGQLEAVLSSDGFLQIRNTYCKVTSQIPVCLGSQWLQYTGVSRVGFSGFKSSARLQMHSKLFSTDIADLHIFIFLAKRQFLFNLIFCLAVVRSDSRTMLPPALAFAWQRRGTR